MNLMSLETLASNRVYLELSNFNQKLKDLKYSGNFELDIKGVLYINTDIPIRYWFSNCLHNDNELNLVEYKIGETWNDA